MTTTLAIDRLSRPEKLRVMEAIWVDLAQDEVLTESPSWHKDALAETARRVKNGVEPILDWEQAKRDLRKRIR
ncbi:MAG: addiction module protein [bacterium]